MTGRLIGVGLGPGDPELLTLKAIRAIEAADVVAYHAARHGRSTARKIADPYLREGVLEELLVYPATTEDVSDYDALLDAFYEQCRDRLAAHLDAGRTVAVISLGDPMTYSSYQHLHQRLAGSYDTTVIPGVTSITAAAAAAGVPLVEDTELLTVIPGTLSADELDAAIAGTDTAVIMKLGRTFAGVRAALERCGRLDDAVYVERATMERERHLPARDVDPEQVPYFSVVLLPSRMGRRPAPLPPVGADVPLGSVTVVGTGPAGAPWQTPEVRGVLATATDLVGYVTYVDRVPVRPWQVRHNSDNKVESERAAFALDLARRGRRVVVVSSGDPGVFAMATAVLEVASEEGYQDIPVRVCPGMTAAHAAAARAGAPLGHDYATISLSDRLKPWSIISERVRAALAADLVVAIYNPASRSRRDQVVRLKELALSLRPASTPVVVARDVGGPTEQVRVMRLADLPTDEVDMRTLLLIGSSQTQLVERRPGGEPQVVAWTPRRYPD
ncbi:precorrin-3B C(17)-methyltransferase [Arsenicicoccus dermatophilus]|uniref:precorrin-3B C(17)-methyltransferase n=1 Tax=Arsenicicoccus dermatophilus TaxID=1076331 RepID=UPI001F4C80B9|nr:precorrin-3B C(17)-methyltransferase [Arsenicicoccus dermatophilus]MCH8612696.1 precorrin-3B C(17)-methyltransferase [Arsenicicoccus dermatophilus]